MAWEQVCSAFLFKNWSQSVQPTVDAAILGAYKKANQTIHEEQVRKQHSSTASESIPVTRFCPAFPSWWTGSYTMKEALSSSMLFIVTVFGKTIEIKLKHTQADFATFLL